MTNSLLYSEITVIDPIERANQIARYNLAWLDHARAVRASCAVDWAIADILGQTSEELPGLSTINRVAEYKVRHPLAQSPIKHKLIGLCVCVCGDKKPNTASKKYK